MSWCKTPSACDYHDRDPFGNRRGFVNRFPLRPTGIKSDTTMRTPADHALDELLVLGCQDGDAGALDALVQRWHAPLLRHAWHLTRQPDAAADVTQEAWLAIVRGIRRLHDPALFRTWAYRIITHKCADWTRRRQLDRRFDSASDAIADEQPPLIDARDEARQLHHAMRSLGSHQRAILSLRYWEQMSIAQIAAVLDVPDGTVKSRLSQARNDLRTILERSMT